MSPLPSSAEQTEIPSKTGHLHPQPRARRRKPEPGQARGRIKSRNELGGRDTHEERVTCIYPRDITKSPPVAKRLPSTSPISTPAYNPAASPLLTAIGAAKNTAQYTNEWTKSLAFITNQASPGTGGIAIHRSHLPSHSPPHGRDGAYDRGVTSSSPPLTDRRSPSHDGQFASFGGRLQTSPHTPLPRNRRTSTTSQHADRRISEQFNANPPLPHERQAHFYSLPDFDLGLKDAPNVGIAAGEAGYFCGFDSLSAAGDEASRAAENVLLIGSQGGLDVFRVERGKMDLVGRLDGLRGAVVGAKLLPWLARHDPLRTSRPLVALIIHGPVLHESLSKSSEGAPASTNDDSTTSGPSHLGSDQEGRPANKVIGFQTTVEVYSLRASRRIATLYQCPLAPLTQPYDTSGLQSPSPVGDLTIDAKGSFVVVASGSSGEIFVFSPYLSGHEQAGSFRCVGKLWTTLLYRDRLTQSSASGGANNSQEGISSEQVGVPVFSLSDRWLALSSPTSTGVYPLNGVALVSQSYERPPGLSHHAAPPQPSAICSLESSDQTGFIDRLTREGTQVALQGARWATEKGYQAFKHYMNKGQQPSGQVAGHSSEPLAQFFPPTHGHNQAQPLQESTVISIFDLHRFLDAEEQKTKIALHAIATIPAALGCSHLSFSPCGIMLMTVSRKGDYQDIWDLKRMYHRRARKSPRERGMAPHVRQIARYARMTVSNVVDVKWTVPKTDRLAVITDRGTVHMFLLPNSALQWPPPRRSQYSAAATEHKVESTQVGRGGAVNSAFQAISGTAGPFLNAIRSGNTGPRLKLTNLGITPAAGAKSGKAVAVGVGKSINNLRHAGDNKLSLPLGSASVHPSSARWLTGRGRGCIALVAGGVVQVYKIQMRPASGKSNNATRVAKKKLAEFSLPSIQDMAFSPSITHRLFPQVDKQEEEDVGEHEVDVDGEWLPRSLPAHAGTHQAGAIKQHIGTAAPLSFSEIETNPPYQPFYTDQRVTRFVFSRIDPTISESHASVLPTLPDLASNLHHNDDTSCWLFGQDIEAVRISSPSSHAYSHNDEHGDIAAGIGAQLEHKLVIREGEDEVEQVVVTTRRRRVRKEGADAAEDGFFEDDCEVLDFAEDRV